MNATVSLKIKQTEVPAKVLMYLKKQTGLSLSKMREVLRDNSFVITLSYYELRSLQRINQMRKDLLAFGIDVELYENDELLEPELLKNLEESYRIEEECEAFFD